MKVRKTLKTDLEAVMDAIDHGKQIQHESGHLVQWSADYPNREVILNDIKQDWSFVVVTDAEESSDLPNDTVVATFCLMTEPEPSYQEIKGAWLNNDDYVTIHRVATNGKLKGAGSFAVQWICENYPNIRIDTHEDNQSMMHIINKFGFYNCGKIKVADGSPRLGFQLVS